MNSAIREYPSPSRQYSRRDFVFGGTRKVAKTAAVSIPLASYLLGSQPAYGQLNNALEIPEAKVTPDLSTGKWLPNEFTNNDYLDFECSPYKNIPSNAAPLPHFRLNHDADTVYALSDLTLDTTLKNDINTMYGFDTANNGLGICNTPANFTILFVLKGSGSSPDNYKLKIEQFCSTPVPDLDKVKATWSYGPSVYNTQKHVIMKEAIPISTLTKYRPSTDVDGIFGLEANLGNTSSYATWPPGSAIYGQLQMHLTGQTNVDFLPKGLEGLTLAASTFVVTAGVATFKKFSERKSRLAKKR